jgi:hypothetical protein
MAAYHLSAGITGRSRIDEANRKGLTPDVVLSAQDST